jgi:hypothetical protein
MDFRAAGQSNERRRRVRADENVAAVLPMRPKARSDEESARTSRYADRARPERQPRLVDLVPLSRLWQNVVIAAGCAGIGGLLAGHWATHRTNATAPAAIARSLDVLSSDSLAAWFRASVLATAAVLAVLVYFVRRHRTDDYRGGYRIWLWAAAWMFLMSADCIAGLRDAWQALCVATSHWQGPAGGLLWWLTPALVVGGTIGVRLVLDMRECGASTAWFGAATLLWIVGDVLSQSGFIIVDPLTSGLLAAGFLLGGQWSLLVAMNWHARHVVLDASGALRQRKKKKKKQRRAEAGREAAAKEQRVAAQESRSNLSAARPAAASSPIAAPRPTLPPAAAQTSHGASLASTLTFGGRAAQQPAKPQHLSKAERKQLKREMRRAA